MLKHIKCVKCINKCYDVNTGGKCFDLIEKSFMDNDRNTKNMRMIVYGETNNREHRTQDSGVN